MSATRKRLNHESGKSRAAATVRFREDHFQAIRGMSAEDRDVREGRMFGYPAFFVDRRMFACIYDDGIGLKVPPNLVARLVACGKAIAFRPHGKPTMREWVQINRACSKDYATDRNLLLAAKQFATSDREKEARI